jgi:hypothetical protein
VSVSCVVRAWLCAAARSQAFVYLFIGRYDGT